MTREAPESVESRRPHKDNDAPDTLQAYRMEQSHRLLGHNFSLPAKGLIDVPDIWKPGIDVKGARPDSAVEPKNRSHDHVVTNSDTLWKIAKDSLTANGDHASGTDISRRIRSIIDANRDENPRLARNPHSLKPGMKLHIPEQDNQNRSQDSESGREHRRSEHRRSHGRRHESEGESDSAKPRRDRRRPENSDSEDLSKSKERNSPSERREREKESDSNPIERALKKFGEDIADAAKRIAHSLGTIGDCAKGPRLTFKEMGFHLPPAVATEQGRMLQKSGLFEEVSREDVRPGDYGVRDWNRHVTRRHGGVNKGDSFIVTNVGRDGTLKGANDHTFTVPEDGGRYRNLKFMRPTAEFYRRYGSNT